MEETYYGERIKKPLTQGVQQLVTILETKPTVSRVEYLSEQILKVHRSGIHENLIIYVVDAYVLGEGATHEIIQKNPSINTILVMSLWNQYVDKAKILAKEHNVALFTFNELMGAVYYSGKSYLDYKPPVKD